MNHSTWTRNPCFLLTLPAVDVSGPHGSRRMHSFPGTVCHTRPQSAGLGLYVFHLRGLGGACARGAGAGLDRRNVAAESRHFLVGAGSH